MGDVNGRQRARGSTDEGGRGRGREGGRKILRHQLEQMGGCNTAPRPGAEERVPVLLVLWNPPRPRSARAKGHPKGLPASASPKFSLPKHGSHQVSTSLPAL